MMLQKKLQRAMDWLKNKNTDEDEMDNIEIEKKDILPLILSALLVFGPLLLILIVIMFLVV